MIDPHGMDPQTVLRFVKAIGGWPGKVVVIACEPADVEEMGWGSPTRSPVPSTVPSSSCSRPWRSCGARARAEHGAISEAVSKPSSAMPTAGG